MARGPGWGEGGATVRLKLVGGAAGTHRPPGASGRLSPAGSARAGGVDLLYTASPTDALLTDACLSAACLSAACLSAACLSAACPSAAPHFLGRTPGLGALLGAAPRTGRNSEQN